MTKALVKFLKFGAAPCHQNFSKCAGFDLSCECELGRAWRQLQSQIFGLLKREQKLVRINLAAKIIIIFGGSFDGVICPLRFVEEV